MSSRRGLAPGCVALAFALTLAACGSTPLSLRDLREDATAICQASGRQSARIPPPSNPAQSGAFLAAGIAAVRPELAQLRALSPPAGGTATFRAATGALSQSVDLLRQARAATLHGTDPAAAVRGLQSGLAPVETRGNQAWRQLGIPACAQR